MSNEKNLTVNELLAARMTQAERPLHVFRVPEVLHHYGVTELGLVELTLEEELRATQRARNDQIRLAGELAKESLRMVNGQMVKTSDGSAERALAKFHPKVRQLLLQAYSELHTTTRDEAASFLASHEVRVG